MKYVHTFLVAFWIFFIGMGMYTHAYGSTIEDYVNSVPQPIVIMSITDCDGEQEWLLGGVLQNWIRAESGLSGYQWLWAQNAEMAYTIASSYFYQSTTITEALAMSLSECAAIEQAIKIDSV